MATAIVHVHAAAPPVLLIQHRGQDEVNFFVWCAGKLCCSQARQPGFAAVCFMEVPASQLLGVLRP